VLAGTIDGVPVGFLLGRSNPLLPQAGEERIASVRLVFTEEAARGVGVGEAMLERFMTDHRATGHRLFDAHVSPGHRIAKNFYEAHGFKARHIVMHHRSGEDG
jgi:GNAT superfamily N-acetyltransferase